MKLTSALTTTALFAAATSASWSPFHAFQRDAPPVLEVRADSTSFDLSFTSKQGNTATTSSAASQTGTATVTSSGSDSQSGSGTITGSASGSASPSSDSDSSGNQTTYDARLPAGGVSMITPAVAAAGSSQYYKIGKDYVTFAWNYTSLSATPSAVDVLAVAATNKATYTIALNQTIGGGSLQTVFWDLSASSTMPVSVYTLIIHDSAKDASAVASAGYLGTQNTFQFGMYTPQPYTPLADYKCATCSGASAAMASQSVAVVVGTVALTVASFGWFSSAAGLW